MSAPPTVMARARDRCALLVTAVLPWLAGCAMYVPSVVYAPLPERAAEVRVRAGVGMQGVSASASVSPFQGAVVFGGIEHEAPTGRDSINIRSRRQTSVGVGAYRNLGPYAIGEVLAGLDRGTVRTANNPFDFGGVEVRVEEGRLTRAYGQLDLGARVRRRGPVTTGVLAFSARVSAVRFTELMRTDDGHPQETPGEQRMTVFEPGFISLFNTGPLRFETGLRLAMPLGGRAEFVGFEPWRTEIALSVALDQLWRRGAERDAE